MQPAPGRLVKVRTSVDQPDGVNKSLMTSTNRPAIENYLMDMDGVLVHQERLIPGADQFIHRLQQTGHRFLVLTNNSIYTPRDLAARLALTGLQVPEQAIWTSALATARFLDTQRPQGSAYVLGEAGLTTALHQVGYVLTDRDPDYVVLGETRAYSTEAITRAIRLLAAGARFIATNPDPTGPTPAGPQPATGAVAALISKATGVKPYFVGKPNPLMMGEALRAIDAHSQTTVMIGDRMDTDIIAGIEAGLQTILVLTGSTTPTEAERFPFLPTRIVDSVADLADDIADEPRSAGWPPARRRILRQAAADHIGAPAPNGQPPVRAANAS
jgi:NagD protein